MMKFNIIVLILLLILYFVVWKKYAKRKTVYFCLIDPKGFKMLSVSHILS